MSNRRIVYIERPKESKFSTRSRFNFKHSFYEFHDEISNERVFIYFGPNSKLELARYTNTPILLSLEEYYYKIEPFDRETMKRFSSTGYFNARPLTNKQIANIKDEHPEIFI